MATKKEKKVIKVKKEKAPKPVKLVKTTAPKYELVTFSVKATIPTQQYGNIMPEIVIKTKNIEEARAVVMPAIESLYVAYAERPRDGSSISFLNKASVTVEEKTVEVPKPVAKAPEIKKEGVLGGAGTVSPTPKETPAATAKASTPTEKLDEFVDDLKDRSPAFVKARKAVSSCTSREALDKIEEQIKASVKLTADEKPELLGEVLKKRKTFA